ncbi:MAG: regulatory protein RecX [Vallitaleaceae bacterium]|nr:regulatory protein RecX [Vallitaleaceae bacterium]
MMVTDIVKDKKKNKIFSEDQFLFSLYYTEIKRYGLEVGEEISSALIEQIVQEVILKRGTTYVYHLLSKKDYTSQEVIGKLLKADYNETQAEVILQIVTDQGFVDDENYARRYISQLQGTKSMRQLMYVLKNKGIQDDVLKEVMADLQVDEYEAAKKAIEKKLKNRSTLTFEEQGKLYAYMMNKGYKGSTVQKVLGEVLLNLREI